MDYEKIKNFLNDSENRLIIRLGMVVFGIIFGSCLILLSLVFDRGSAGAITFLVFGCVTYFSFLIAPAVWYVDE